MEKDTKEEGMGNDLIEMVLRELLAEQQKANDTAVDQAAILSQIAARLKVLEENTGKPVATTSPINTMAIEKIIQKGMLDMQLIADHQPKNVVRKIQVLLFPEHDTALYCRIVFGRWVFWLVVMLCITDLYKWAIHYSDNQKELQYQEQLNKQIAKPRSLPNRQQGKESKKVVDSVGRKTNNISKAF